MKVWNHRLELALCAPTVLTPLASPDDALLAARKFAKIMTRIGLKDVKFKDFTVQNIVGTASVGFPIRLEGLADDEGKSSSVRVTPSPVLLASRAHHVAFPVVFCSTNQNSSLVSYTACSTPNWCF